MSVREKNVVVVIPKLRLSFGDMDVKTFRCDSQDFEIPKRRH